MSALMKTANIYVFLDITLLFTGYHFAIYRLSKLFFWIITFLFTGYQNSFLRYHFAIYGLSKFIFCVITFLFTGYQNSFFETSLCYLLVIKTLFFWYHFPIYEI